MIERTPEDEEFDRIEREIAIRKTCVLRPAQ